MKLRRWLLGSVVLFFGIGVVGAAGPVDGEVSVVYWDQDLDLEDSGGTSTLDGADVGFRGELWIANRFGFRGQRHSSDLGDAMLDSIETTSLDFIWRAWRPTEHSYFGVGAGFQEIDLSELGLTGDPSGLRVNVEGQVGVIGWLRIYGRASVAPDLGEESVLFGGTFEDIEGREIEVGARFKVAPFVHVIAAFRTAETEGVAVDITGSETVTLTSEGFLAGVGIHF